MAVPVISAVTPSTVVSGTASTFGLTATNTPTSWAWTFGSPSAWGSPSTSVAAAPSVTPTGSGILTGSVTATNADGTSAPYYFAVTVIPSVETGPLVRLSVLKEHIKSTASDAGIVARLKRYARQATQLLESYTGRVLVRPASDGIYVVSGTGTNWLPAAEWPLSSTTLTEIRVGTVDDDPLDAADWAIDTTKRRTMIRRVDATWTLGTDNIFLVGKPGYDTSGWDTATVSDPFGVPARFEEAVMEQCAAYAKRFQTTATDTVYVDQAGNRTISRTADVRDLAPAMRALIQQERKGGGA